MPASRRIFGLFTLVLMSWAAVWCCCAPAAVALRHARGCCERPADDDRRTCPTNDGFDHCPIVHAREQSVAPTLPAVPDTVAFVTPLPTWLTAAVPLSFATAGHAIDRIQPATGPPTLLALHTSLVT